MHQSVPSRVKVRYMWRDTNTPIPAVFFMIWCLIKNKYESTFWEQG
jgi:hypothetical protein